MPRWKNPKPQQHSSGSSDLSDFFAVAETEDMKPSILDRPFSVSSPSPELCEIKEKRTREECLSRETREYTRDNENNDSRSLDLRPVKIASEVTLPSIDPLFDKPKANDVGEHALEIRAAGNKTRRPSFGLLSPNILAWLKRRFTLKENAKTSASQVIRLYEKEFQEDVNVPLQSYQVGQLLRRIFPNIQRCKITVNGKRVWVYKHLSIADTDAPSSNAESSLEMSNLESNKSSVRSLVIKKESESSLYDQQISSSVRKTSSMSPTASNPEQRHVKNSAILYNLLYPRNGSVAQSEKTLVNDERATNGSNAFTTDSEADRFGKRHAKREGNVVVWLRDNYEYADGYYVRSMDVLRKYNQGQETMIKYLSQVGRVIKFVFPRARHLRRSLKGGKREWVYHNIRPKDYSDKDIWRGSVKNLVRDDEFAGQMNGRPSMISFPTFSVEKRSGLEQAPSNTFNHHETKSEQTRKNFLVGNVDNSPPSRSGLVRPDDGRSFSFSLRPRSSDNRHVLTPNSARERHGVFHGVETKNEIQDSKNASGIPWWFSTEQSRIWEKRRATKGSKNLRNFSAERAPYQSSASNRRSHLELQIDRLKTEKSDVTAENLCPESTSNHSEESYPGRPSSTEQAEDLSMQTAEPATVPRSHNRVDFTDGNSAMDGYILDKENHEHESLSGVDQVADLTSNDPDTQQLSTDHNYSYCHNEDDDYRLRDLSKSDLNHRNINEVMLNNSDNSSKRMSNIQGFQQPSVVPSAPSKQNHPIQWEDLSMCGAHRYGWTLTPTLNNEIPSNFIEWVLFEGQLIRDGQRVYRELKIYEDWSVTIHAMGKKVYPDELGGITDLTRTRESVSKVFATLSSARSCRGLPALCLSDLCVHGVVVAKAEIWSSREGECEELRHRAINCQMLYRGSEESCPKCSRVIRMHSLNPASSSGNNGFTEKSSNRFTPRCGNAS